MDANTGTIKNVYLAKKPYTAFSGNEATPVEGQKIHTILQMDLNKDMVLKKLEQEKNSYLIN